MKPGDTATGSVTLTNDGDIPGTFSLSTSNLSDVVSAPYTGDLSDVLTLKIMDGATQVYSGPINSVGTDRHCWRRPGRPAPRTPTTSR